MAKKKPEKRQQINIRAYPDDFANMVEVGRRLRDAVGEADNSFAIRYALRRAVAAGQPIIGEVGAGRGKIVRYDADERLDADMLFGDGAVAYRVRGDSMRDKGILPGDWIIVREQPPANKGEIVVARIDSGLVVKSIDPAAGKLYSGRGEDAWEHAITEDDVVLGVYVGVVRKV